MEVNELTEEDKVRQEYEAVCSKLNMDQASMEAAWTSYTDTRDYYTLEGNHMEWLGCALYVAGQSQQLETMEGQAREGNSVSLTQILRATKLNLIEFFKKMKKWLEYARLPQTFHAKIEALERKFEVASIIYDKYRKVFKEIFDMSEEKSSSTGTPTRARGRKPNHKKPCSAYEVFKFGWTLYIHIKSQYPQINDDLVSSHHLLLCCLDMLSCAAYTKRQDLLHKQCSIFQDDLVAEDQDTLSVLTQLCKSYNGIDKECRVIRDYFWNNRLRALFEEKVLQSTSTGGNTRSHGNTSDAQQALLVLSPGVFQVNDKNMNRAYEMSVLEKGDFDERVFLHPSANEEIGTPIAVVGAHNFRTSLANATTPPQQHVQYGTPLLGREMLGARDHKMTPASEATHSVSQLHVLVEGCLPEPSEYVRRLCGSCMINPLPSLEGVVKEMGEKLVQEFPGEDTSSSEPSSFAKPRLRLSMCLYYKLLDAIMADEEKKNQDFGALQNILEYSLFHKALFSLCVEIVLFSYNSQSKTFPWVLRVFGISAYHFYKLIEMAIKLERDFPRGIVKHLNRVEEMVLSRLAWVSDSPLFDAIDAAGSVPPYKDVALPSVAGVGHSVASPLIHPRIRKLGFKVQESPLSALHDRHTHGSSSPGSTARRALFSPGGSVRKSPVPIAPKPPPQAKGGVTVQLYTNALQMKIQRQQGGSPTKDPSNTGGSSDPSSLISSPLNVANSQSPPGKSSPLSLGEPITAASTVLSPSKAPPTSATPGSARPLIPTSPPIPSVTITQTTPLRGQGGTPGGAGGSSVSPRPKRTGSLALFYRKMYQLAFIRIKDLCERLALTPEFIQKVWTCFEHSMVKSPDLLRDRHLDQIIMCNIYVLSKALRINLTFQEIMRQYRHQPQAKAHVYRTVLLNNGPRRPPPPDTSSADPTTSSSATPAATTDDPPEAPPTSQQTTPLEELLYPADTEVGKTGDIIKFYNTVFIGYIKDFVLQFSPTDTDVNQALSPLPVISKATPSPRKLSKHHNIFVSPHKPSSSATLSPLAKPLGKPYIIQRSPNVELRELNKAIRGSKRAPPDLSATSPCLSPAKRPALPTHLPTGPTGPAAAAGARKTTKLLQQAIHSVASERARTVSTSSD